jgi:arginine/ornithine N-succinyltransferase beta subunit
MTSSSSANLYAIEPFDWETPKVKVVKEGYPVHRVDVVAGAQTVGVTNLMENIKGLEFRLSALEKSYASKLKEHEETVEMLLKVIKDAAK